MTGEVKNSTTSNRNNGAGSGGSGQEAPGNAASATAAMHAIEQGARGPVPGVNAPAAAPAPAAAKTAATTIETSTAKNNKNGAPISTKDVFVASAALGKQNSVQLPDPNKVGNIEEIPLEKLDPSKKPVFTKERETNKFDTSIPVNEKTEKLEKFEDLADEKDELLAFIKKREMDPENQFPREAVASFNPNGVIENKKTKFIRNYIQEYFYSDYYYNVSLVFGTCLFSYILAYWSFSFLYLLVVFFVTGSLYKLEFRRYTRNIRDDIKRVHMHETLSDKIETTTWLNSFVSKFWVIYMPTLSQQVKDAVNPALEDVTPGYGIDALTLDEFTLGSKAPTIDSIQTYTKRGDGIIEMDWKFSFTPNDTSNMTVNEVKSKINPKIALGITIGKGLISKSLPVLVENINVAAHARITIKLSEIFPNVKVVSVSLLEPPLIDFALKPVGGDTLGLDIMSFLPGLKTFVTSMINSNAGPMLYAPNKLDIDVEQIIADSVKDCIGVLAVTVNKATELAPFENGQFNPFVSLSTEVGSFNGCAEKYETSMVEDVKKDSSDPSWSSETKYILINSLDQKLTLNLMSKHLDSKKDHFIGKTVFNLTSLYDTNEFSNNKGKLYKEDEKAKDEKKKGILDYSLVWYPVVEPKDKKVVDESSKMSKHSKQVSQVTTEENNDEEEEDDPHGSGVLKMTLKDVTGLDISKTPYGVLNPTAELYVDQKLVKSFRSLKRINEPSWEEIVEVLVPSKTESEIKIVINDTQFGVKEKLCEYVGGIADLQQIWDTNSFVFRAQPCGAIRMNGSWKQLKMETEITSTKKTIGSTRLLGALRVHLRDGHFHNDDLGGVGDVDPYVNICLNNVIKFRTNYFSSNKTPNFNTLSYIPVTSENQLIKFDVFDYQKVSDDRFLGSYQFPVMKYMNKIEGTDNYKVFNGDESVQTVTLTDPRTGKVKKSVLNCSVSFVPTVSVYSPDESDYVEGLKNKIKEQELKFSKEQEQMKEQMKLKPNEYELVDAKEMPEVDLKRRLLRKQEIPFEKIIAENDSGILVFEIEKGANFKPKSYLQILVDDFGYPAFISNKIRKGTLNHTIGSVFIRDLKNSKIILRTTKEPIVKSKSDVIEEMTIDALQLLKASSLKETVLQTPGGSKIQLKSFLYPTVSNLPASEKIVDTGVLSLQILNAVDLISHDRNGKSDPFVKIRVDGTTVHKTEVVKKNLDPTWNESCTVPIPSRARSKIIVEVYDWDRAGSNDLLCSVPFPSQDLSVNGETQNWKLPLHPKGVIYLKSVFKPQYSRPSADFGEGSLAGMPLKMLGSAANLGVGVAGAGLGAVGGVAGLGVSGISKGAGKGGKLLSKIRGVSSSNKESATAASSSSPSTNGASTTGSGNFSIASPAAQARSFSSASVSTRDSSAHQNNNGTKSTTHQMNAARSSLDYDPSVPNLQYVPVSKYMAEPSRTVSSSASVSALQPKKNYPCHVQIIQAENIGTYVQIKSSITCMGKLKSVHNTEPRRSDKQGVIFYGDEFEFEATPECNLIFGAVAHHTFNKNAELGFTQVHLGDPQIQQDGQLLLRLNKGSLIIKLQYGDKNEKS